MMHSAGASDSDRLVLDVDDPSKDDELIDWIIAWIEARDPHFFLSEDPAP
jgi:hypothetical protein